MVLTTTWPAGLPSSVKYGARITLQPNTVRFDPEVGPSMVRRRATVPVRHYEMTMTLDEKQGQPQSLLNFYETALLDGTLAFTGLKDPFGQAKTFRFTEPPQFQEGNGGFWDISFKVEEVLT